MNHSFESLDELMSAVRKVENPSDTDRRAVRQGLSALFATTIVGSTAAASATGALAKTTFLSMIAWPFAAGALLGTAVIGTVGVASRPELLHDATPAATATVVRPSESPRAVGPVEPKASPENDTSPPNAPPPREERSPSAGRESADSPPLERAPVEARTPQSLEAESRALAEAQRALRDGDTERALRLLDEQERDFSGGALAEERAAARVLGLCRAGRLDEGRRAAERFRQRFPSSLHGERVA